MERKFKRQQRTIGAIVEIPLKNGFHTYARILEVEMAFYDIHTKKDLPVKEIINSNILFIATVYDSAITKGFWSKISKAIPLEENLINTPPKYTQNRLNLSQYKIHYTKKTVKATKEECIGLEYWSVWQAEEIEERLNKYFSNIENPYIQRMKRAEMYSDKVINSRFQQINKEAV